MAQTEGGARPGERAGRHLDLKNKILLACAALLLILFSVYVYRLLFPRTLADDAKDVLHASLKPDGATLYRYAQPSEIQLLGWTPSKLQACFEKLVAPVYARCRADGPARAHVNLSLGAPAQGVCTQYFETPNGRKAALLVTVEPTDQGSRTSAIGLVMNSWFLQYHVDHPEAPWTGHIALLGMLEGYERNKGTLRAIGVPGTILREHGNRFIAWNEWEKLVESSLGSDPNPPVGPRTR